MAVRTLARQALHSRTQAAFAELVDTGRVAVGRLENAETEVFTVWNVDGTRALFIPQGRAFQAGDQLSLIFQGSLGSELPCITRCGDVITETVVLEVAFVPSKFGEVEWAAVFQNEATNPEVIDDYELVVREDDHLQHYRFDYGGDWKWHKGETFGSNVQSAPVMFQNRANNNYEIIVRGNNQLQHYWFHYVANGNWVKGAAFGADSKLLLAIFQNDAPELPGENRYELIAGGGDQLRQFWFDYLGDRAWHEAVIGDGLPAE